MNTKKSIYKNFLNSVVITNQYISIDIPHFIQYAAILSLTFPN